jgi:hypothetical protein
MDAVPDEPENSSVVCFACVDHGPAGEVDRPYQLRPDSPQDGGAYVDTMGSGKTFLYVGMSAHAQRVGRVNRVRDALDQAYVVRDMLDDQLGAGGHLVLGLDQRRSGPVASLTFNSSGLLAEYEPRHVLPLVPALNLPGNNALVSSAVNWDAEPDAPWQALPSYANRPIAIRSCWGASALTSEAVAAAQTRKLMPAPAPMSGIELHEFAHRLMRDPGYRQMCEVAAPLTVIIRDKQLAQDYRQGLRCFVDVVMEVLGRMVVMILAALSRLAQTPSFLLVMLAVARHYGRRSEPDDHTPLITRVHPMTPRGAACLAT